MARPIALSPAHDLLPVEFGACRLEELVPDTITWVAPFDGTGGALGFDFPDPGEVTEADGRRALWFGPGQALVLGDPVSPERAAVADQSDAWVVMRLQGDTACNVLARLTPLDVRDTAFPYGRTARTLIGHMTASLTRVGANAYEIMVFRSMAKTAVHEISRAMKAVAARG